MANVKYNATSTLPKECFHCKGKCYVKGDQAKTQSNARAMFGKLPNPCVNAEGGIPLCPAIRRGF